MSALIKITTENQKEMLNILLKSPSNLQNLGDSDSEAENTFLVPTLHCKWSQTTLR